MSHNNNNIFAILNKQPFNLSSIISLAFIHYFVGCVLLRGCSVGGAGGPECDNNNLHPLLSSNDCLINGNGVFIFN
jgi:hypothetical protein